MSETILEGHGLTRRYTTDAGQTLTACRGVDISLNQGRTLGIVGESGCGKSTLLRMLTQLEQPMKATCFIAAGISPSLRAKPCAKTVVTFKWSSKIPPPLFLPA